MRFTLGTFRADCDDYLSVGVYGLQVEKNCCRPNKVLQCLLKLCRLQHIFWTATYQNLTSDLLDWSNVNSDTVVITKILKFSLIESFVVLKF